MDWLKEKETDKSSNSDNQHPLWNILIVDDDEQIHLITRQVLRNFEFENRNLEFFSAYSGREAREMLKKKERHYALILLDVVMESDDEGLKLARFIREEIKNHFSRIVLRTGQPGTAPEYMVVREYDIDAYKSKTEMKKSDMEALFYTVLRSYRDITALQKQRKQIEQVVSSITAINRATDLHEFSSAILSQINLLMGSSKGTLQFNSNEAYAVSKNHEKTRILALSGDVDTEPQMTDKIHDIKKDAQKAIDLGFTNSETSYNHPYYVHYMKTHRKNEILLTIKSQKHLTHEDEDLLKLFSSNVTLTYENLMLNEEILETQNLLIRLLGGAMESRSRETGSHVRRVGELSALLAGYYGLAQDEVERFRIAAPLHDVGKVSIPDKILHKPGSLDSTEWKIMQQHSTAGYELLKDTEHPIIEKAALIARDHHEKWDGSGYPAKLKGEEISIEGRIVALADVFDALTSCRVYKEPWDIKKALQYIESSRGIHFDPLLVDLFLQNKSEMEKIKKLFPE